MGHYFLDRRWILHLRIDFNDRNESAVNRDDLLLFFLLQTAIKRNNVVVFFECKYRVKFETGGGNMTLKSAFYEDLILFSAIIFI